MGRFLKQVRELLVWLARMTWEQHQMSHPSSMPSGTEGFPYPALPALLRLLPTSRAAVSFVGTGFSVGSSGSGPTGGLGLLSEQISFPEASENFSSRIAWICGVLKIWKDDQLQSLQFVSYRTGA